MVTYKGVTILLAESPKHGFHGHPLLRSRKNQPLQIANVTSYI